jgi:hypothetical protein
LRLSFAPAFTVSLDPTKNSPLKVPAIFIDPLDNVIVSLEEPASKLTTSALVIITVSIEPFKTSVVFADSDMV